MDMYEQVARNQERTRNTFGSGALDYDKRNPQAHEAIRDLRAKADRGDAEAQFRLAEKYHFNADSDFLNHSSALELFSKSAIQGHSEALKQLKRYAEKGSPDGDGNAEYCLGRTHQHGCGVLKDNVEAAKWMTKAAEAGHVEAQYILGVMYHKGRGVSKHPEEEAKWLCKAAYRGKQEAIEYLKKSAELGSVEAQYNLGYIYEACILTRLQDDKESARWYAKAAEQNHAKAQLKLGGMYHSGKGVLKDPKEEAKWLRKAARNSDESALILLQRSAEKGVTEAQYNLGFMYAKGEGVLKDMRRAKELLGQAYEKGDPEMKAASKKVSDECELWKY